MVGSSSWRPRFHRLALLVPLAAAALTLAGGACAQAPAQAAIVGARVYPAPDAPPIDDAVILVRGGRIAAVGPRGSIRIPAGARRIDAHGRFVTAGFWNSHVHLIRPEFLDPSAKTAPELDKAFADMLTRWGFTTVFDISSHLPDTETLRRRIGSGEVAGPMILTAGDGFFPEHGTPIYIQDFMQAHHFPSWEVSTPEQAAARARRQLDEGADGVKLFTGAIVGGKIGILPMRRDIATAVVEEAHRRGKPALAHPSNLAGLQVALDSGVDVLAHATDDGPWPADVVRRLTSRHTALIPTMTLFDVEFGKIPGVTPAQVTRVLDVVVSEVKTYADAGGQILFGTDVGYTDAFDTTEEYRLMGRALDWRAILASLTTAPAGRFGHGADKGRVAPGMDADLVILDGDPATDPQNFARVRDTIRGGRVIWGADAGPSAR